MHREDSVGAYAHEPHKKWQKPYCIMIAVQYIYQPMIWLGSTKGSSHYECTIGWQTNKISTLLTHPTLRMPWRLLINSRVIGSYISNMRRKRKATTVVTSARTEMEMTKTIATSGAAEESRQEKTIITGAMMMMGTVPPMDIRGITIIGKGVSLIHNVDISMLRKRRNVSTRRPTGPTCSTRMPT